MKAEYDFTRSVPNPFAPRLAGREIVLVDSSVARYFKKQAAAAGMSWTSLVNVYLRECAAAKRTVAVPAAGSPRKRAKRPTPNGTKHRAGRRAA